MPVPNISIPRCFGHIAAVIVIETRRVDAVIAVIRQVGYDNPVFPGDFQVPIVVIRIRITFPAAVRSRRQPVQAVVNETGIKTGYGSANGGNIPHVVIPVAACPVKISNPFF